RDWVSVATRAIQTCSSPMVVSPTASQRARAMSHCPTFPVSASRARAISQARWRHSQPDRRGPSSIERDIEAKRTHQQALAIIEAVTERVLERGIEHELAAAERAAFRLETIKQPRAMAVTALALLGHQIIDIEKAAVHQILLHAEARERDWSLIAPERDDRVALLRLPPPTLDELRFRAELRAQHAHQRVASGNVGLADHADVRLR